MRTLVLIFSLLFARAERYIPPQPSAPNHYVVSILSEQQYADVIPESNFATELSIGQCTAIDRINFALLVHVGFDSKGARDSKKTYSLLMSALAGNDVEIPGYSSLADFQAHMQEDWIAEPNLEKDRKSLNPLQGAIVDTQNAMALEFKLDVTPTSGGRGPKEKEIGSDTSEIVRSLERGIPFPIGIENPISPLGHALSIVAYEAEPRKPITRFFVLDSNRLSPETAGPETPAVLELKTAADGTKYWFYEPWSRAERITRKRADAPAYYEPLIAYLKREIDRGTLVLLPDTRLLTFRLKLLEEGLAFSQDPNLSPEKAGTVKVFKRPLSPEEQKAAQTKFRPTRIDYGAALKEESKRLAPTVGKMAAKCRVKPLVKGAAVHAPTSKTVPTDEIVHTEGQTAPAER